MIGVSNKLAAKIIRPFAQSSKFSKSFSRLFKTNYQISSPITTIRQSIKPAIFSSPFHLNLNRSFAVSTENLESLGDSITSAVVVSWAKEPGDAIKEDDVIAVVETDKVTMDIKAKKNGVFVEGLVASGGEIAVGAPLYKFDSTGF